MKIKSQIPPNQHFPETTSVIGLNSFHNHSCIGPRKLMFGNYHAEQAKSNPAVEVPETQ